MARLVDGPIDAGALLEAFCKGRTDVGAVVSFTGLCRAATDGRAVETLTLDAWRGFTEDAMTALEDEARARFDLRDLIAVHRWGEVRPGEAIVFVAAAAAHRRTAFHAADYLMDQLKTRAPLWKREDGPDGRRWIEARPADHADAARWNTTETT